MQIPKCTTERDRLTADRQLNWLKLASQHIDDVIFDQKLFLDRWRVCFAPDFLELRSYIHPFEPERDAQRALQPDVEDYQLTVERILAVAFLLHAKRPCLLKPLLLDEYLREYVEHQEFVDRIVDEGAESAAIRRQIETFAAKLAALGIVGNGAAAPSALLTDQVETVVSLLKSEFPTLARLAYVAEMSFGSPGGSPALDLTEFTSPWDDSGFEKTPEHDAEYQQILHVLQPSARRTDTKYTHIRYERDASALMDVLALNRRFRESPDKERVVYLLTSAKRFWPRDDSPDRDALRNLTRVGVGKESTSVIRHPFCIAFFLCLWPGSATDDATKSRAVFLEECQAVKSRLSLATASVAKMKDFYDLCCGHNEHACPERIRDQCRDYRRELAALEEAVGSWRKLSYVANRHMLLPPDIMPHGIDQRISRFVSFMLDPTNAEAIDRRLGELRAKERGSLVDGWRQFWQMRVRAEVDADFLRAHFGKLSTFPFYIAFGDTALRDAVSAARLTCLRAANEADGQTLPAAQDALVGLANRILVVSPAVADAPLLAAALSVLFEDWVQLRYTASIDATVSTNVPISEWRYVRALSIYIESRSERSTRTLRDLVARVTAMAASSSDVDVRVSKLVTQMLIHLYRQTLDLREPAIAIATAESEMLGSLRRLAAQVPVEGPYGQGFWLSVQNNLAYGLALTNKPDEARESYDVANAIERAADRLAISLSVEVTHTIALSYLRYARVVPVGDRRADLVGRSLELLGEVWGRIAHLSMPTGNEREECRKHVREAVSILVADGVDLAANVRALVAQLDL